MPMDHQAQSYLPAAQRPKALKTPWHTTRTIIALMLREMTTTYGRSPGGYLWALLEPIGSITMLTLVISAGLRLRQPSLGISFVLFYATGMLVFQMYLRSQQKISQSISYSRSLLRYPAVTVFDAIAARFLLGVITHAGVFFLVMAGVLILFDTRAIIDPGPIFLSLAMAAVLALGIGTHKRISDAAVSRLCVYLGRADDAAVFRFRCSLHL